MYMILASKLVLLLPLIILVFYKILNKINIISFFRFSIKYLIVLSILVLVIDYFFRNDNAIVYLASLLFLRTIGNGGLLNFWYYDFFANHPFTYFSHINFINFLGNGYPYGNDGLGKVVGTYYWASDMNANANFWATDGIASSGIYGVLIISIVLFVLLIIIDNITNLNENNFSILILLPFIASLTNTSLFSSLLTGGLFINIFIFYFLKIPRGSKS